MPAYAYILLCGDGRFYYRSTNDLRRRLGDHHRGRVRSTQWRRPARLVYFEEYETLPQARQRERMFKGGRMRAKAIKRLIAALPPERLAPFA